MRQEFQKTLVKTSVSLQSEETEPEGESTEICSSSPPRVIHLHYQHLTDYVKLFMEEGKELTMGEDWVAPLIREIPPYYSNDLIFKSF